MMTEDTCYKCSWFLHTTDRMGEPTGGTCDNKHTDVWWDELGTPYGDGYAAPDEMTCNYWERKEDGQS